MRDRPSAVARLALWAIRRYQRHLSPRKGFSCAYRVHKGGASCSSHGYRAIARHGLLTGLTLLDRRLSRCGEVYRAAQPAPNPMLHYQRGDCDCLGCGDITPCEVLNPCSVVSPCDILDCDFRRRERWTNPCRGWRERRWLAKAAKLQRERAERERRERFEAERQERERQAHDRQR